MYPKLFFSGVIVTLFLYAQPNKLIEFDASVVNIADTSLPDILKSAMMNEKGKTLDVVFRLSAPGNVHLKLSEMNGKNIVYDQNIKIEAAGEHTQVIDMQNVRKGSYVLEFRSRDKFSAKKLIVKN